MLLPKFDYHEPSTMEEALKLLSELGGNARVLAGGTDLLCRMKQKIDRPSHVISIARVPGLDEVIPRNRVKGFVEGPVPIPEPPEKVRRTAVEAAKTNQHKIGDRVMVQWHNHWYPAAIVGVVGPERYRIHYEGYGNEWDENVGPERIKAK